MASKQQQAFKMCVHPCPRYLTGGDTHILCVACLGKKRAQSALESAGCEHCDVLPLRTLRSRLAYFREDAQARVPHIHCSYLILRNWMLPMQEILKIRHLSLVLMRSWLRL